MHHSSALTLSEKTDRTLIEEISRRDQASLQLLYDRYAPVAYGLALRITGNQADAADAVLDSFWQIWQQSDRYDAGRGEPNAWILTIVRSRSLDRFRSARRCTIAEAVGADDTSLESTATAAPDPEQSAWSAERTALVRSALAELTPLQRNVLELAYYEGLSHSEIAGRLGEPLGTVKTRIRLGLIKLREKLSDRLTPFALTA